VTTSPRAAAGVLAVAFFAAHVSFLPSSLEDLDSINFALGIRDFDVANHQPHPPGYPIFIVAAKGVGAIVGSEVGALSLMSIVAGALAAFPLTMLAALLLKDRRGALSVAAALLAMTAPLFWITSARPLSDSVGLAVALGLQALILNARHPRELIAVSLCAGVAAGIRSQIVWLTVPLLVLITWRVWSVLPSRSIGQIALAYLAGILIWFVPLVAVSGGPAAYWHALTVQGAEDFAGPAMLSTNLTVRRFALALLDTFVTPWASVPAAVAVLAMAAIGIVRMALSERSALVTVGVAFIPYLIFHLLFQETITTRYR
jgi:hypothetical protein